MSETRYQVNVGNIGTVYDGTNRVRARHDFDTYVKMISEGQSRAEWPVVLFQDEEILAEENGPEEETT